MRGPRPSYERFPMTHHDHHDNDIVLAAPVRTPIGKFGGVFSSLSAADLGTVAATGALERAGLDPASVDQVIFGHGRQAGGGPNTARQIGFRAGVPVDRPAYTVNQACASGLQAVLSAARTILNGEARVILAGGTESMSNTPYLLPRARWGYRMGNAEIVDGMYQDGFNDPLSKLVMGETAEELAAETGIDRAASDAYALESQLRCERARGAGPLRERDRAGQGRRPQGRDHRHHRRAPARRHDDRGDGEAPRRLPRGGRGHRRQRLGDHGRRRGHRRRLARRGPRARAPRRRPAGRLGGGGRRSADHGDRPGAGGRKLLAKTGVEKDSIDEVELNEAFAAQVLACNQELAFDPARLNPDGGAIALGHPIGATGARILVTLLHGMEKRGGERGIATLCVSGGMGIAALVEREAAA